MESRWAVWASRLSAIAQNGLTYAENSFDRERYTQVRNIAAEIARVFEHHRHPEWPADLD